MGIQINGQTDTISAVDGGLAVSGYELTGPSNINVTGIVTATTFSGALSGNVTGNLNSSGVSTVTTLNATNIKHPSFGSDTFVLDSSGNINIDSGGVYYDATNNRFGIGTTAPRALLDIGGGAAFSAGTYQSPKLAVSNGYISIKSDPADGVSRLTLIGDSNTGDGTIDWGGNGNFNLKFTNNGTERMRLHSSGYLNMGGFLSSTTYHRINGINATEGTIISNISGYQNSGGSSQDTAYFFSCGDSAQPSSSAAAVKVFRISSTSRSINAAGSINASGADYAEYMFKDGDFTIAKGDVCGVNVEGKLTNVFADAVAFVVKSTDPSYVGGDTWHLNAGEAPGGYDDDRTEEEIAEAKVVYEQNLETVRQMVDRIAFSGQVPVNVTGATPGQYIVPAEAADGGIEGVAKNEDDLTLAEYMRAVGKVIAIEDDGRARIIVKVA